MAARLLYTDPYTAWALHVQALRACGEVSVGRNHSTSTSSSSSGLRKLVCIRHRNASGRLLLARPSCLSMTLAWGTGTHQVRVFHRRQELISSRRWVKPAGSSCVHLCALPRAVHYGRALRPVKRSYIIHSQAEWPMWNGGPRLPGGLPEYKLSKQLHGMSEQRLEEPWCCLLKNRACESSFVLRPKDWCIFWQRLAQCTTLCQAVWLAPQFSWYYDRLGIVAPCAMPLEQSRPGHSFHISDPVATCAGQAEEGQCCLLLYIAPLDSQAGNWATHRC